jgi:hypothetical protein
MIAELLKKMESVKDQDEAWQIRNRMAIELQSAERYEDAARVHGINVFAPEPSYYQPQRIRNAAMQWSICKRIAAAVAYFDGHLDRIIDARQTVYNVAGAKKFPERVDGFKWLNERQVIGRLKDMDAGVLALVFEALDNQPLDEDLVPYISIIKAIGSEQDAPVLLGMIDRLADHAEAHAREHASNAEKEYTESESKLAAAINDAIESLTKKKCPATPRTDQLKFWVAWWNETSRRIVGAEVHPASGGLEDPVSLRSH